MEFVIDYFNRINKSENCAKPVYTVIDKTNDVNSLFILSYSNKCKISVGEKLSCKNNGMIFKIIEILNVNTIDNTITVRFTTFNGYYINNEIKVGDLLN